MAVKCYSIYGVRVKSPWPLPFPELRPSGGQVIEICERPSPYFSNRLQASPKQPDRHLGFQFIPLPDGGIYLEVPDCLQFVVEPDGSEITFQALNGCPAEVLHAYLLGHVLSFAMLKLGFEPLHSTVVVVNGEAVGFLGDCGYGKSSLAAAFLGAGYRLLTDDLLVVHSRNNNVWAQPGPPRIKLFPEIAEKFLGHARGTPVNPDTAKLVIPLEPVMVAQHPLRLSSVYVLDPPANIASGIEISEMAPRAAFRELLANTFNDAIVTPDRLKRQFELCTKLAANVPIRRLSYPRRLSAIDDLRRRVLADLAAHSSTVTSPAAAS